jgi:hypothetical protein
MTVDGSTSIIFEGPTLDAPEQAQTSDKEAFCLSAGWVIVLLVDDLLDYGPHQAKNKKQSCSRHQRSKNVVCDDEEDLSDDYFENSCFDQSVIDLEARIMVIRRN